MELCKLLCFGICIGTLLLLKVVDAQNSNDIEISKSSALFAAKMLKQLSHKKPDENILISPISIQLIMGLLKLGAEGLTAQEISDVLELPINDETLMQHLSKLQRSFKREDLTSPSHEPNITMSNSIYVRQDVNVSDTFYKTAKNVLNVDVRPLTPFNVNATIVEEINERIANETNGQLTNALDESDVTLDTVMLLINTLHFKGKWLDNGFNVNETKMEPFYADHSGFNAEVPMMRQTDHFHIGRYRRLNVTYLELPYSGRNADDTGDYVFGIYLPDVRENIVQFLDEYTQHLLMHQPDITNTEQVDVRIPRFQIKSNNKLKQTLEQLGLRHVFNNAQLPHLTADKKSVQVTDVSHNTALEVSEEGTEASAATVVGIDDRIFSQPIPFVANRPFLFVLKQKSTDIILFVGHYKNAKE